MKNVRPQFSNTPPVRWCPGFPTNRPIKGLYTIYVVMNSGLFFRLPSAFWQVDDSTYNNKRPLTLVSGLTVRASHLPLYSSLLFWEDSSYDRVEEETKDSFALTNRPWPCSSIQMSPPPSTLQCPCLQMRRSAWTMTGAHPTLLRCYFTCVIQIYKTFTLPEHRLQDRGRYYMNCTLVFRPRTNWPTHVHRMSCTPSSISSGVCTRSVSSLVNYQS